MDHRVFGLVKSAILWKQNRNLYEPSFAFYGSKLANITSRVSYIVLKMLWLHSARSKSTVFCITYS